MPTHFRPDWQQPEKIRSVQTVRTGGFSQKPWDSLNLGVFSTDPAVPENLRLLTAEAALPHEPRFAQQTHSSTVVELHRHNRPAEHGFATADACITRDPGVVCAVLTADCLPVLLADKAGSVVAAVHAGWRGLYGSIIRKAIAAMGVSAESIHAWIGPGIGYGHYTVGEDFRQRFVAKDPALADCFYLSEKGQWHADLKRIAHHQLQQSGVHTIAQSPLCTHENKALFYSHRRDARRLGDTGRQASLIWIDADSP